MPQKRKTGPNWKAVAVAAMAAFGLGVFAGRFAVEERSTAVAAQTQIAAPAQLPLARVVAVADGDTLTILSDTEERIVVRLAEIDAPEGGQPWGPKAKEALSGLTLGQEVEIRALGRDQYGRLLARVYSGGKDINAEMIREGHAWAYRDYLTDASLLDVEGEARAARRGLWSAPSSEAVPPWAWRRGERPQRTAASAAASGGR